MKPIIGERGCWVTLIEKIVPLLLHMIWAAASAFEQAQTVGITGFIQTKAKKEGEILKQIMQ